MLSAVYRLPYGALQPNHASDSPAMRAVAAGASILQLRQEAASEALWESRFRELTIWVSEIYTHSTRVWARDRIVVDLP